MFQSARIKLTAWYLLIIFFISVAFSAAIYRVLSSEIERFARAQRFRIEHRLLDGTVILPPTNIPLPPVLDMELLEETRHRVIVTLFIVNSGILFLSGILSYLLAGRTLQPIKEMVDQQNHFISDASHEFRTPLTSLKTAMEVYLRDKQPTLSDSKILVKESLREVNALSSLSEALLELTNYERLGTDMTFSTVSLVSTVKESILLLKPLAQQKKITIYDDLKDERLEAHGKSLTQLWVILLDNAIKYSEESTAVTVKSRTQDGMLIVTIEDTGIGIPKEDIPHIFDRFYRADKARSKNSVNGFGLGLAIAKEIVERHNGSILVNSEEKKGTKFTVRLPKKH